jgi:cell shape-determining protein MreC
MTSLKTKKNSLTDFLLATPNLSRENEKLKQENNLLKVKVKKLTDLVSNQNQLKNLTNHAWESQPIKLVSLDNLASFTSLDFANIRPGQPVATGNSLVGLVKSVEPPIIKVTPLNHSDIKLGIQLDTGAHGDYIYKKNEPHVINLDSGSAFNSKTTVFTLPTDVIPENLIVGQIDKITSNPTDPTLEATILLDSNISSSPNFFVITKP